MIPSSDSGASDALSDVATKDAEGDELVPCAVGNLCRITTPLTLGSIAAVAGRSSGDVWASASRGVLMHWDGQAWTAFDSHMAETFTSLFLTPDEAWAASGTAILRRDVDPSSVRSVRLASLRSIAGVAVLPNGDAYVGFAPHISETAAPHALAKVADFDAGKFELLPDPVVSGTDVVQPASVRAMFLTPDEALWLVGDRGSVVRYPVSPLGAGVVLPLSSQATLYAAWGQGKHLWTVGRNGAIFHFDGTEWHTEASGTTATLNAVFGFSNSDIWAAGEDGTVLHFDGTTWSRRSLGSYQQSLRGIWGATPEDVWIGGDGAMFHWGALR